MSTDDGDVQSPSSTNLDEAISPSKLPMLHDSMVTVRLSEPPTLSVDTRTSVLASSKLRAISTPISPLPLESLDTQSNEQSSGKDTDVEDLPLEDEQDKTRPQGELSPTITTMDPNGNEMVSLMESERDPESRRGSDTSETGGGEVNWEELAKTEEQEPRSEASDDVSIYPSRRVGYYVNANLRSRPHYCWHGLNKKTTSWPRTQSRESQRSKSSRSNEIEV